MEPPPGSPATSLCDSKILALSWPKTLVIIIHSCKLPSNNFICAAPCWLCALNSAVLTTDYLFLCCFFFFFYLRWDVRWGRKKKQKDSWIVFVVVVPLCCTGHRWGHGTRVNLIRPTTDLFSNQAALRLSFLRGEEKCSLPGSLLTRRGLSCS